MRALKVLVVVMGLMIVVGFTALIVIIIGRVSNPRPQASTTPVAAVPAATPATSPNPVSGTGIAPAIDIPAGARIEAMSGGADRLVMALVRADGTRELLVIDLVTGKKQLTIPLRAAP